MGHIRTQALLSAVTVTGAGTKLEPWGVRKTFQLTGKTSTGVGAASVKVEGSLDGDNWKLLDTLTLTLGTVVTSDFGVNTEAWRFIRGDVDSISGTNGEVTLTLGLDLE